MEFKVYQKELELQSRGWIPTFHDVSREVVATLAFSKRVREARQKLHMYMGGPIIDSEKVDD